MDEQGLPIPDDVVEFLKHQHDLIKSKFDEVLDARGTEVRRRAFAELSHLLAVHESAEAMVIHPRARHEIAEGATIVGARLAEEHEARERLAEIAKMDFGSADFRRAVTAFRDAVLTHAVREEDEEFAKLKAELGADELKRMADEVRAAEAQDVFGAATQ